MKREKTKGNKEQEQQKKEIYRRVKNQNQKDEEKKEPHKETVN